MKFRYLVTFLFLLNPNISISQNAHVREIQKGELMPDIRNLNQIGYRHEGEGNSDSLNFDDCVSKHQYYIEGHDSDDDEGVDTKFYFSFNYLEAIKNADESFPYRIFNKLAPNIIYYTPKNKKGVTYKWNFDAVKETYIFEEILK